jgi:hypothetical protein
MTTLHVVPEGALRSGAKKEKKVQKQKKRN